MQKENKVTPQLTILTMSRLKDSHKLILFIGCSFIVLAILSFLNIIILDISTIISISLSGILFILADFFEYYGVILSEKVNSPKESIVDNIRIILICKSVLIFFAILFLILSSYIKFNLSDSVLNNSSTALALIAIGLTIIKISLDNAKSNSDFGNATLIEISEIAEVTEKRNTSMENEQGKTISKVANETVNDFTEKALLNLSPELIKTNIISEIKTMFQTLLAWFIGLLCAIFVLNILYLSHNDSSIENASLKMIETLDGFVIIKNYIGLGIIYFSVFALFAHISGKFKSENYEKNRTGIIELRNIVYILFIVSFCLKSFTVNQLDLVSLIISLVLFFKIVFKTDNTLSEKEIKKIMNERIK